MRYNDKILIQAVICLAIFALVRGAAMIEGDSISKIKDAVKEQSEKNYSIEDIKEAGSDFAGKVVNAPKSITAAVTAANEVGEFGKPIDEDSKEDVLAVHATAGGEVIYAGIDKDLGVCIKIKHEEKTSTYGNLYTLTTVTGERVKKGDIIGTFDNDGEKEFYYQLNDSVV